MYIKYNSVQKFNSFIIVNAFIPQVGFLGIVWELDPLHRVCVKGLVSRLIMIIIWHESSILSSLQIKTLYNFYR